MLFSATQTRKVEDLARISLKKEPLYVGVDDNKDKATVDGLEQVPVGAHVSEDLHCDVNLFMNSKEVLCLCVRVTWCARQRSASCCSSLS